MKIFVNQSSVFTLLKIFVIAEIIRGFKLATMKICLNNNIVFLQLKLYYWILKISILWNKSDCLLKASVFGLLKSFFTAFSSLFSFKGRNKNFFNKIFWDLLINNFFFFCFKSFFAFWFIIKELIKFMKILVGDKKTLISEKLCKI